MLCLRGKESDLATETRLDQHWASAMERAIRLGSPKCSEMVKEMHSDLYQRSQSMLAM